MVKTAHLASIILPLSFSCLKASADSNSAALAKLRQIPPPVDYVPKDDNNPKIPLLVLTARGASINHGAFIPFDQVVIALAELPPEAWTQGRLILYYDSPPGLSSPGDQPPAAAVKQVEKELKAAEIKLIVGASA